MKADRALAYLKQRPYIWIPVTSDDTIEALRELRRAGHDIKTRPTDDGGREAMFTPPAAPKQMSMHDVRESDLMAIASTVFQDEDQRDAAFQETERILQGSIPPCLHPDYARQARTDAVGTVCMECGEVFTTVGAMTPGSAGRTNALKEVKTPDGKTRWEVSASTCPQCGEEYLVRDEHVQKSARHQQWARGELTGPEIPVPKQQPTYKFPVDMPVSKIEFGLVITCPRCHGKRLPERYGRGKQSGIKLHAEDWCRDPDRKDERCMRCNGHGIIPNAGPVVTDSRLNAGRERDYG